MQLPIGTSSNLDWNVNGNFDKVEMKKKIHVL